jgi:hypothetical protein
MISAGVSVGFVSFNDPVLLFCADSSGLFWLSKKIAERADFSLRLHASARFISIQFEDAGDRVVEGFRSDSAIWRISRNDGSIFSSQLLALSEHAGPVHAYLDSRDYPQSITVIASKDEYPLQVYGSG